MDRGGDFGGSFSSQDWSTCAWDVGQVVALPFRSIHDEHARFVWLTLRRFGVAESALDDAVQDVFVAAYRRMPHLEDAGQRQAWLWGVSRRIASRYRRSLQRLTRRLDALSEILATRRVRTLEDSTSITQVLTMALAELDDERREVYWLVEVQGYTLKEAAQCLELRVTTVESRLRIARALVSRRAERLWNGDPQVLTSALENAGEQLAQVEVPDEPWLTRSWLALLPKLQSLSLATVAYEGVGHPVLARLLDQDGSIAAMFLAFALGLGAMSDGLIESTSEQFAAGEPAQPSGLIAVDLSQAEHRCSHRPIDPAVTSQKAAMKPVAQLFENNAQLLASNAARRNESDDLATAYRVTSRHAETLSRSNRLTRAAQQEQARVEAAARRRSESDGQFFSRFAARTVARTDGSTGISARRAGISPQSPGHTSLQAKGRPNLPGPSKQIEKQISLDQQAEMAEANMLPDAVLAQNYALTPRSLTARCLGELAETQLLVGGKQRFQLQNGKGDAQTWRVDELALFGEVGKLELVALSSREHSKLLIFSWENQAQDAHAWLSLEMDGEDILAPIVHDAEAIERIVDDGGQLLAVVRAEQGVATLRLDAHGDLMARYEHLAATTALGNGKWLATQGEVAGVVFEDNWEPVGDRHFWQVAQLGALMWQPSDSYSNLSWLPVSADGAHLIQIPGGPQSLQPLARGGDAVVFLAGAGQSQEEEQQLLLWSGKQDVLQEIPIPSRLHLIANSEGMDDSGQSPDRAAYHAERGLLVAATADGSDGREFWHLDLQTSQWSRIADGGVDWASVAWMGQDVVLRHAPSMPGKMRIAAIDSTAGEIVKDPGGEILLLPGGCSLLLPPTDAGATAVRAGLLDRETMRVVDLPEVTRAHLMQADVPCEPLPL